MLESLGKIKCLTTLEPRMTTEAADRNYALHDIRKTPTREWLHRKCGHFQQVPVSGGVVECENCEELIELKPKQTKQDGTKLNPSQVKRKVLSRHFPLAVKLRSPMIWRRYLSKHTEFTVVIN